MIPAPEPRTGPIGDPGGAPTLLGSGRAALAALAVIFAANFLSYLDRTLVSALEEDLKTAFDLRGAGFGALWTLFTIGYMVCAVPVGYLADRRHRPRILSACIVVWSIATIMSGLAPNPWFLYVSRFLIGAGEAGCLIIGQAVIADLFSARSRGKALSIFHLGLPLGGTGAFILAGVLHDVVEWRALFYLAGAPGFIVAALLLSFRDPPRGGAVMEAPVPKQGLRDYVALFRTRTLLYIIVAQAFAMVMIVSIIHFGVEFFRDYRNMPVSQARLILGLIALLSGGLGSATGGWLGDRLARKRPGGYALLAGVAYLAAVPCLLVGFLAENRWVSLLTLGAGSFFLFMCMPAVNAQIAGVVHPAQRAMAWSLAVFVLHLFGDTTSPILFGWASDALGRMMAYVLFLGALVAAGASCLKAARTAPRDLDRLRVRMTAETPAPGVV